MKRTPLYDLHVKSGGKMVEFAGFEMPVQYSSILDEHHAVRNAAGIFDVSHMGEFTVKGKNATLYLSRLIPTSMFKLEEGKGMYTLFCRENGCVIDDLFIFMENEEHYFLVVNASTTEKDFGWMKENLIAGVEIADVSEETAKIDIQGPASRDIMKKIFDPDLINLLQRFSFCHSSFSGSGIMISATGYTGETGFELFIHESKAARLWERLMSEGADAGIKPAGLGARDTLRLEACYSLYGHEINESINPVEAGLGWLISSDTDFIGKAELLRLKNGASHREQVCVELIEKGVPREGYRIKAADYEIGYITSGAYSPTLKRGIALALVKKGNVAAGDLVDVVIRTKGIKGKIVKKPFYKFNG